MIDQTPTPPETPEPKSGRATYSPEDNKIRLYVGRVPRDEFLKLRAEGWTTLHKQREAGGGDFAATWSPSRLRTALQYADMLEDEDMGPEERAADRAERFGGYRDKRTEEAGGRADAYEAQPIAHGYQSEARAARAVARHDRIADHALDAWSKAEYWIRRTAGVIAHALYKSSPGVRMGRIKLLEAEIRKCEANRAQYAKLYEAWQKVEAIADPAEQTKAARLLAGSVNMWSDYMHPRPETVINAHIKEHATSLCTLLGMVARGYGTSDISGAEACALFFSDNPAPRGDGAWETHYRLRLAYELQMLAAQGGRLEQFEVLPGGKLGGRLIVKVNKSAVTGRATSAEVKGPLLGGRGREYRAANMRGCNWAVYQLDLERLDPGSYTAPTPESLAELKAALAERKAATPKKDPCPLINPTEEEAERLQAIWNERAKPIHEARHLKDYGADWKKYAGEFKPATVTKIKQATYSANSKGAYAKAETKNLCALGTLEPRPHYYGYEKQIADAKERGPALCKLRVGPSGGGQFTPPSVIVLTDKPQKPFPAAVWEKHTPAPEPEEAPEIECSACNQTSPRNKWETHSGHLLFGEAMTCPRCNMQHPATKEGKTAAVIA